MPAFTACPGSRIRRLPPTETRPASIAVHTEKRPAQFRSSGADQSCHADDLTGTDGNEISCSTPLRDSPSTRSSSGPGGTGGASRSTSPRDRPCAGSMRSCQVQPAAGVDPLAVTEDGHAVADGAKFVEPVGDVDYAHAALA